MAISYTNEYLAWCKEHDYLPKFDQFADHPNYYKLLIDFRAYDYNGIDPEKMANRVYQPQQKITMNFPENFNDLVAASLAEQQATKDLEAKEFTDAQGSLLNDVKDVLGLNDDGSRAAGEDVKRYSHEIDDDVLEAAKLVYGGGKIDAPIVLDGIISNEFAHDVEQITGIDVRGFGNRFSRIGFEHIKKRHGVNGEQDHSMADPADVAGVRYVLHNYDDMWLTKKKSRAFVDKFGKLAPTICIRKKRR